MGAAASGWSSVFGAPAGRCRALALLMGAAACLAGAAAVAAQELEWAATFDIGMPRPWLAVDAGGSVYAASEFAGTHDFDPGPAVLNLSASGTRDTAVLALDRNGNFRWAAKMGGFASNTIPTGLALDSDGNVIVGGSFSAFVDFDPGPGTLELDPANGTAFLVKLDQNGALVWAVQLPGAITDLAVTAAGEVVSVGRLVQGTVGDFDPGPGTVTHTSTDGALYLSKLDASAGFVSVGFVRNTQALAQIAPLGFISIDASGTIHLAVKAWYPVDMDPGAGTTTVTSPNAINGYTVIIQLSPEMAFQWGVALENASGSGPSTTPMSVTSDSAGATYVAGNFNATIDFEPGAGTTQRTAVGGQDGFVVKLNSSGSFERVDQVGGTGALDEVRAVSVDQIDRLHLSGRFGSTVDFDLGPGTFELTALGNLDAFVAAFESDGTLVSAQQVGGAASQAYAADMSATVGRIVVSGNSTGTVDLDPGPGTMSATGSNAFLLQLVIPEVFADGFEAGGTSAWSAAVP